jgi:hypothetical protein
MQPGNQEFVDSLCRHVRGNPIYADGYGRWFSNPLLIQSKALDLVHKLHWQRAEGATMWDHYLLQHYVPEYLIPLFNLASSVWEDRHWLMSTNLTRLNYVPVYMTHMNMELNSAGWCANLLVGDVSSLSVLILMLEKNGWNRIRNVCVIFQMTCRTKRRNTSCKNGARKRSLPLNHGCVHIRSINLMAITKTSLHFAKTCGSFLCPERITMSLYLDIGTCSCFH